MRKMKPNSAKKATEIDVAPTVNRLFWNTRTSRSGPSVRNSTTANAASTTSAASTSPMVRGDAHPHAGPSMIP